MLKGGRVFDESSNGGTALNIKYGYRYSECLCLCTIHNLVHGALIINFDAQLLVLESEVISSHTSRWEAFPVRGYGCARAKHAWA